MLALCTGVPWRARPEAVLSLIICLTAGRSAFLKHVAACLFLGWAVQFTKGGHTTTLVQVMLLAASGTPQWCTRRLKLALVEYSSISHCQAVTPGDYGIKDTQNISEVTITQNVSELYSTSIVEVTGARSYWR